MARKFPHDVHRQDLTAGEFGGKSSPPQAGGGKALILHFLYIDVDPPPDVIIEVDLTHPSLGKFPIYAILGVPEVWRYAGQQVLIYRLVDDAYQEVAASTVLTGVTAERLSEWVLMGLELSRLTWIRRLRAWAETLVDVDRGGAP